MPTPFLPLALSFAHSIMHRNLHTFTGALELDKWINENEMSRLTLHLLGPLLLLKLLLLTLLRNALVLFTLTPQLLDRSLLALLPGLRLLPVICLVLDAWVADVNIYSLLLRTRGLGVGCLRIEWLCVEGS